MGQRLTFRDKQTVTAWQYKVREERRLHYETLENPWDSINKNLKNCIIKEITRLECEKIILEYEWLGTLPTAKVYYGAFFDNVCGGVVAYRVSNAGAGANSSHKYGITEKELAYLIRGACVYWTPNGTASKLISFSLNMLKKKFPFLRVVIAFSDLDAGEYGTVYQATNWLCVGFSTPSNVEYIKGNRKINSTDLSKWRKKRGVSFSTAHNAHIDDGFILQKNSSKCRYCYILDKDKSEIMERIKHLITEYPKRKVTCARNIESDVAAFQP